MSEWNTNVNVQVNVSELGMVTQGGKVVWGKYAQVRYLIINRLIIDYF